MGADESKDAAEFGQEIRDLLGAYQPPADPYLRVAQRVRARRARRRAIAAAVAAGAAVTVVAVAVSGVGLPSPDRPPAIRLADPAAPTSAERATGAQFAQFGDDSALGPAYLVAQGAAGQRAYRVASVNFGWPGRTCLFADDAVFAALLQCFAVPTGGVGTWAPLTGVRAGPGILAVGGVVNARFDTVAVRTQDGRKLPVRTVRTPTSADLAFFALVLPGSARIAEVTVTNGRGAVIALPREDADPCQLTPDCATRPSTAS
jgi:hypothetical protein